MKKFEITALVVRNKKTQEILEVQIIKDYDTRIQVDYPVELVGSFEDVKKAVKNFSPSVRQSCYTQFAESDKIHISDEPAGIFPNIGDVQVKVETKEIEWE
jgi:hypothetical protein